MLFINEDRIRLEVRAPVEELRNLNGDVIRDAKRSLFAQFERNLAPRWAVDYADSIFTYPTKQEGVTTAQWLSSYDSQNAQRTIGWTNEEREEIEQALLRGGYVVVEQPKVQPPWPRYDEIKATGGISSEETANAIAEIVTTLGIKPHEVMVYERANLNREYVMAAMEKLEGIIPEPAEEDLGPLIGA